MVFASRFLPLIRAQEVPTWLAWLLTITAIYVIRAVTITLVIISLNSRLQLPPSAREEWSYDWE